MAHLIDTQSTQNQRETYQAENLHSFFRRKLFWELAKGRPFRKRFFSFDFKVKKFFA